MSSPTTETDTFTPSVVAPDVLDTTYPADVRLGIGALANRTNWLQNTLRGTASGSRETLNNSNTGVFDAVNFDVPAAGRAGTIYNLAYQLVSTIRFVRQYAWGAQQNFLNVPIEPVAEDVGGDTSGTTVGVEWDRNTSGGRIYWRQTATHAGRPRLYWYIKGLPPTGTINQIAVHLKGVGGHAGLPTSMPKLELYRCPVSTTPTPMLVATASDTSASTGAYQALHIVNNSSFTESITANANYMFILYGEAGANALALLEAHFSHISITTNA